MTGRDDPGRPTVVIGVGNEFRRDDGAGPAVIARLRALQPDDHGLSRVTLAVSDGEPGRLIDLWQGARLAVVIDAVRDTASPPGHTSRLAPDALASAADGAASSHRIGLGDTVELARVLGRLPARLTVLTVVGRDFGLGAGLTAEVAAAVADLAEQVRELVRSPDRSKRPGHQSRIGPFGKQILKHFFERALGSPSPHHPLVTGVNAPSPLRHPPRGPSALARRRRSA